MSSPQNIDQDSVDLFSPPAAPRWAAGLFAVLLAGLMVVWLTGRLDPIIDYAAPQLVETSGKVTFNGEPLQRGLVMSKGDVAGRMGGLGEVKPDGTFTLSTNGDPGIYSGTHRLTVSYMTSSFPPVSLLPDEYTQPQTTPFRFSVKRGKRNHFELSMKGELKVEKKPGNRSQPSPVENSAETPSSEKTE